MSNIDNIGESELWDDFGDNARVAEGTLAESMTYNSFVKFFHPTGWVGAIREFVSSYELSEQEYLLLKEKKDITVIPEYEDAFYYKEAMEAFFKKYPHF